LNKISKLEPADIPKQFPGVPSQIVNGVLERFAEKIGHKHKVTESRQMKLIAYLCTLYLVIDGWSTDIAKVATDLKMKTPK
jgi:DNA-directed RNA polymerase I subunit RPA49